MAPQSKKRAQCQVCSANPPKYACSRCYIAYCSVPCYKTHQPCGTDSTRTRSPTMEKETSAASTQNTVFQFPDLREQGPNEPSDLDIEKPRTLRPLTSLKWPYVPEETAFPDPLKRDDPKDLQLRQYQAIATSSKIREILNKHENLPIFLTSIDKLRGNEREDALQKALGVLPSDIDNRRTGKELSEDILALRELAEAVETAIRGDDDAALGLNWGDES